MANKAQPQVSADQDQRAVRQLDLPRVDHAAEKLRSNWYAAHHCFAERLTHKLRSLFRSPAEVSFLQLESGTATSVSSSSPPQAGGCCIIFHSPVLVDPVYLRLDVHALFMWIDCILGGSGRGMTPHRQMTAVEQRLMRTTAHEILSEWDATYWGTPSCSPTVTAVVHRPHDLELDGDRVALELAAGPARGVFEFVVSAANREILSNRLQASLTHPTASVSQPVIDRLGSSKLELIVHLAELSIRTSELMGLQVGDIITTDTATDELVSVSVEGKPKFQATIGSLNGQKAIRLAG